MTRKEATHGLGTAMDARALNLEQTRHLFNPTPEADSLAEEIAGLLGHGVPVGVVARLTTRCRLILESNVAEGDEEMTLAAIFETEIQRALMAPVAERATVKSLARKLRGPLAAMLDPADSVDYFRACCAVRDVLNAIPAEQLLTESLRHELRARRFDLLSSLLASTTEQPA